jgi:fatty acid desaturase
MLDSIKQIWNDETLYGHCLTSLPGKIWRFTNSGRLITYTNLDIGSAKRYWLIFEKGTKTERYASGKTKSNETVINFLVLKYAEIALRAIVGGSLASVTAAPLGFAIKIIHKGFFT